MVRSVVLFKLVLVLIVCVYLDLVQVSAQRVGLQSWPQLKWRLPKYQLLVVRPELAQTGQTMSTEGWHNLRLRRVKYLHKYRMVHTQLRV